MMMTSEVTKIEPTVSLSPKPKRRSWTIQKSWLLIPLASLLSVIMGMTLLTLGVAIGPLDRSVTLVLAFLLFPFVCGPLLLLCLGNPRPWRLLFLMLVTSVLCGIIAWYVTHIRWS